MNKFERNKNRKHIEEYVKYILSDEETIEIGIKYMKFYVDNPDYWLSISRQSYTNELSLYNIMKKIHE